MLIFYIAHSSTLLTNLLLKVSIAGMGQAWNPGSCPLGLRCATSEYIANSLESALP
jgi:hypothetical protein